jgi:3-dehydroquinate synthase
MSRTSVSVKVGLGDRSYSILLGAGTLPDLSAELDKIGFAQKIAIVTNDDLHDLYGRQLQNELRAAGREVALITIPEGEEHKTLRTLEGIYDELIQKGFDRSCGLLALGGGVIGDTAGFAAATFLRGIDFVQVPTTLLAQVDSSVGGKTAVNHPLGKNLIGAFYQPKLVLIDIDTLDSLDQRELSAGLAEVVKYGVIADAAFFSWLEVHADQLLGRDKASLIYAIRRSCQIKADIVAADEREGSVRAKLNYGHTFGHAIESLSGYGQWRHGEAVAAGMVMAANLSRARGLCRQADVDRIRALLTRMNLPTVPPRFSLSEYVEAMRRDKKVRCGSLTMVLNSGIGVAQLEEIADIETEFAPFLQDREA